jgi:hypothetical protein
MNESILKDLASQGLSTYKIAERMNCAQTTIRYWLKKFNLTTAEKSSNCKKCQTKLDGSKRLYCSQACKNTLSNQKFNSYKSQQERGKERKLTLIKMKGGCCEHCGYSKNNAALQFHHQDPTEKEHSLDMRKLSNSTWEWCLSEAAKCKLLCANCHAEEHHPQHQN